MARQQIVMMTDDLDGSEAETTISFGFDGLAYEIDLSGHNAQEFRSLMGKYLAAGTRKGKMVLGLGNGNTIAKRHAAAIESPAAHREMNQRIREWAMVNGFQLADRGRIPEHIVRAYHNGVPQPQQQIPDVLPDVLKADPQVVRDASTPPHPPVKKAAKAATHRTTTLTRRGPAKAAK